ncbi:hypothetical protein O3G_MSEX004022 [Manduca sexta]|uniref:Uncharacterized protein n=1 Tax=Manduca sexta TaxID=7130 RepID=A0A922CG29_MANSE|nr:hypothetical protein O3G_MSEX004022 [Manduca sexta]
MYPQNNYVMHPNVYRGEFKRHEPSLQQQKHNLYNERNTYNGRYGNQQNGSSRGRYRGINGERRVSHIQFPTSVVPNPTSCEDIKYEPKDIPNHANRRNAARHQGARQQYVARPQRREPSPERCEVTVFVPPPPYNYANNYNFLIVYTRHVAEYGYQYYHQYYRLAHLFNRNPNQYYIDGQNRRIYNNFYAGQFTHYHHRMPRSRYQVPNNDRIATMGFPCLYGTYGYSVHTIGNRPYSAYIRQNDFHCSPLCKTKFKYVPSNQFGIRVSHYRRGIWYHHFLNPYKKPNARNMSPHNNEYNSHNNIMARLYYNPFLWTLVPANYVYQMLLYNRHTNANNSLSIKSETSDSDSSSNSWAANPGPSNHNQATNSHIVQQIQAGPPAPSAPNEPLERPFTSSESLVLNCHQNIDTNGASNQLTPVVSKTDNENRVPENTSRDTYCVGNVSECWCCQMQQETSKNDIDIEGSLEDPELVVRVASPVDFYLPNNREATPENSNQSTGEYMYVCCYSNGSKCPSPPAEYEVDSDDQLDSCIQQPDGFETFSNDCYWDLPTIYQKSSNHNQANKDVKSDHADHVCHVHNRCCSKYRQATKDLNVNSIPGPYESRLEDLEPKNPQCNCYVRHSGDNRKGLDEDENTTQQMEQIRLTTLTSLVDRTKEAERPNDKYDEKSDRVEQAKRAEKSEPHNPSRKSGKTNQNDQTQQTEQAHLLELEHALESWFINQPEQQDFPYERDETFYQHVCDPKNCFQCPFCNNCSLHVCTCT